MAYGVELPGDQGPLCERCREEIEQRQGMAQVTRAGTADDYRKVTRLMRWEKAS